MKEKYCEKYFQNNIKPGGFMEIWDSKISPVSLQDICDELICENPGIIFPI